ncbi:MAG: hypothetical protein ACYCQI_14565 [Gammaproteobacteria bacterium]
MVKIPGLDDLKKMGSGLIDQAKAVNFAEMVDKVKSGIDSVGGKKSPVVGDDETLKGLFQGIFTSINELTQAQAAQLSAIKKIEKQLEDLAKVVETYQKPAAPAAPEKPEDNKT